MSGRESLPFFYQPLPESPPLPPSQNLPPSFMPSSYQINNTISGTSLFNYYCTELPSVLRHNLNEVENDCVMDTAEVEGSKEEENEERGMEVVDEGHHHRIGEALISGDVAGSSVTRSNGIDAEKYVESGNPYFIAKLHKGRADLHIPKALIGGFSLNLPQTITVLCCEHVERNEETHIPNNHGMLSLEVREWKDGRECVKGWTSFCSKNKIDLGSDVCICEFVLGEDQQIQMLEVHVVKNGQIGVEEEGVNEVKNDCMMGKMRVVEGEKDDSEEVHTRGHPYRTDKAPISGKRGAARSSASRNYGIDAERYIRSENPYFFAKLRKRRGNTLHIPKALIEGFCLILPQTITLLYCEHAERNAETHFPNNDGMCVEEVCESKDGRVCVKGWTSFCSTNNINLGNDVCICEFVLGEDQQILILVVHVVKNGKIGVEDEGVKNDCMMAIMAVEEEKDGSEEVHAVGHPHTPGKAPISGKCGAAEVSVTRNNGIDADNYVQSHNPYFFAKIRKRRGNTLHIPKALIEDFSLILPQTITLLYCEHAERDEDTHIPNNHGMCTEKVCESKDGRVCVKGWTSFCSTNKINLENDVCICEFVFGEDQQIQMLVVHVVKNGQIGVVEDRVVNEVENNSMIGVVTVEEDNLKEGEEQEKRGLEEEEDSEEVHASGLHHTNGRALTACKNLLGLGGAAGSPALKQGIIAEKFVQSHNPYFIAKLHKHRANELHIPKAVIGGFSRNLPQTSVPQTITLLCCAHVERSEETHIRNNLGICTREVCEWKDDRVFIRGWRSFCIKNKINLRNDVCICEFVLGEDKQIQMLEVHVVKNGQVG